MVSKNEKTSSFESGVLQIRRKSNKIDKNEKFLNREFNKSEFVERFPELSLFFKAYSLLDSEMICIFPYFCPYAESVREIREIFS